MSVQPGTLNLTLQRRADYSLLLEFFIDDQPWDLTGYNVIAQIYNEGRTLKYADFTVTNVSLATGKVRIGLADTVTATLPLSIRGTLGSVYWDVMLQDATGFRAYYVEGLIFVSEGYSAPP